MTKPLSPSLKYSRRKRAKLKAAGKCIICSVNDPVPGFFCCDYCLDTNAEYKRTMVAELRRLGQCIVFGCKILVTQINPKTGKLYAKCPACRKKNAESVRKCKQKKKQQQAA